MGNIAKATNRIGYNLGFDKLRDALIQREKERDAKATYEALGSAFQEWQNRQNQLEAGAQAGADVTGSVTNPFAPTPAQGGLRLPISRNVLGEIAQAATIPTVPHTQTESMNPEQAFQKAQSNLADFQSKATSLELNKNFDAAQLQKLNDLIAAAQGEVNTLKPKTREVTTFDPEKDVVYKDTGEVIREGKPKVEKPKASSIYERVETFDENGTPVKKGLRKDTGKWEDLGKAYYKPTGSGKTDENGYPDVTKEVSKAQEGIQAIKDLKKNKGIMGKEIGLTGKDAGKLVEMPQDVLDRQRDKLKQKYIAPILEAIKKRDLQDAVDVIRTESEKKGLKKFDDIGDVIDKFIKANPDYKPEKDVLLAYFELFLL